MSRVRSFIAGLLVLSLSLPPSWAGAYPERAVYPSTGSGRTASRRALRQGIEGIQTGLEEKLRSTAGLKEQKVEVETEPLTTFQDHSGAVKALAFSPDGEILFSGGEDRKALLRLVSTQKIYPLARRGSHRSAVSSAAFSPNKNKNKNKRIVAMGYVTGTAELFELTSVRTVRGLHAQRRIGPDRNTILKTAFSRDGKTVIFAGRDGTIRILRASTGELLHTLSIPPPMINKDPLKMEQFKRWLKSMAIEPEEGLAALSREGSADIQIWKISDEELELLRELHTDFGEVWDLNFNPDATVLASGSSDGTVRLWRVSDGALLQTLRGHGDRITSATFSPNGRILASADVEGKIRFWDPSTGKPLRIFDAADAVWSLAFSSDGTTLASGQGNGTVKLWSVTRKTQAAPKSPLIESRPLVPVPGKRGQAAADDVVRGLLDADQLPSPHQMKKLYNQFGYTAVLTAIQGALADSAERVRLHAIQLLNRMDAAQIQVLDDVEARSRVDKSPAVREAAARVFKRLSSLSAGLEEVKVGSQEMVAFSIAGDLKETADPQIWTQLLGWERSSNRMARQIFKQHFSSKVHLQAWAVFGGPKDGPDEFLGLLINKKALIPSPQADTFNVVGHVQEALEIPDLEILPLSAVVVSQSATQLSIDLLGAGLEEKGIVEVQEQLEKILRNRVEPVTVTLEGFSPQLISELRISEKIGPFTTQRVQQEVERLLNRFRPGTRFSLRELGRNRFQLSLIFLPITRTYPSNRAPGHLQAGLHLLSIAMDQGRSFETAYDEAFGTRRRVTAVYDRKERRPLVHELRTEVSPAQIRDVLGVSSDTDFKEFQEDPYSSQRELLRIAADILRGITLAVYEKDKGEDARQQAPPFMITPLPLREDDVWAAIRNDAELKAEVASSTVDALAVIEPFILRALTLTGLNSPVPLGSQYSGLEEKTKGLEGKAAAGLEDQTFLSGLWAQAKEGIVPIVIGHEFQQENPEIARVLAGLEDQGILLDDGQESALMTAVERWGARRIIFAGLEAETIEFDRKAHQLGILTVAVDASGMELGDLILAALSQATGLEASVIQTRRDFQEFLERRKSLVPSA